MATPHFDLEERTAQFAARVRRYVRTLPIISVYSEDLQQLVRSSGSVGANYIEANEALGKKDFIMRIRISLKEAKESAYWLRMHQSYLPENKERSLLIDEAGQLVRIFASIIQKIQTK